jgi:ComF family protein
MDLPMTDLFENVDNDMEYRLAGRMKVKSAAALYYFAKGTKIQEAMHSLKYGRDKRVAEHFGKRFATQWLAADRLESPDIIIPVPLHQKRRYQRGYNQSKVFASSISETLNIPLLDALMKTTHTESQTHKSRQERVSRLQGTIKPKQGVDLKDKHILLVDDVLTTGATIEVCYKALFDYDQSISVSVGTMAIAENL